MGANIIIFRINQIPTQLLNNHKYSLNCANIFMNMRTTITIVAIAMLTLGISLSAGAQSKNRSADQEAQELEKIKRETTILKEGDKAADFTGKRFAGGSFKLADQKGKVVMLLFWGGWCPPCRHELRPENLPATPYMQPALSSTATRISSSSRSPIRTQGRRLRSSLRERKARQYIHTSSR